MFSLNFSSVGKGPFMDGKAKNIYFSKGRGGRGDGGVRDMDPPSLGNFLFPYFKTYFTQICCRYLGKQIKTFDSNNFTMSPKCMSLKRKATYTVLV